ncbi:hypothetical protein NDU88_004602 [Pleurodeles waltl]|uniref:Uncharacterized protein n=1 Tax=Pleurodeles waltl TaxID=8319 RepID=A0AAV7NPS8_PLEWA|nr:hypothetical protein NDU88_004602 [Pleurodeles waltl]
MVGTGGTQTAAAACNRLRLPAAHRGTRTSPRGSADCCLSSVRRSYCDDPAVAMTQEASIASSRSGGSYQHIKVVSRRGVTKVSWGPKCDRAAVTLLLWETTGDQGVISGLDLACTLKQSTELSTTSRIN